MIGDLEVVHTRKRDRQTQETMAPIVADANVELEEDEECA